MIFNPRKHAYICNLSVSINGNTLEPVSQFKYLVDYVTEI